MEAATDAHFKKNYQSPLQHLKRKGLQPKTIAAYARAVRRIGERFDHQIDQLCEQQLTDYFTDLVTAHSWSSVKLDLYGLKFYYAHVLPIRKAKGNRDRFVPLPQATHQVLPRFWQVHRNPVLLLPNRHGGWKGAATATTPMDRGGVQTTLHQVVAACGLKKRSPPTACATRSPRRYRHNCANRRRLCTGDRILLRRNRITCIVRHPCGGLKQLLPQVCIAADPSSCSREFSAVLKEFIVSAGFMSMSPCGEPGSTRLRG